MPYAKTSLRRQKQDLREQMRSLGLSYRDIAAEFARRFGLRPRAAWREAYGWSLQDTADRINEFRGKSDIDAGGSAAMKTSHMSEYETWPGFGPKPSGRRPTPQLLAALATIYDCSVTDLIDLDDRKRMPPADLLILDKYSQPPAQSAHPGHEAPGQAASGLAAQEPERQAAPSKLVLHLPGAGQREPAVQAAEITSRRELPAARGALAAGVFLPASPAVLSEVPEWAAALCRVVIDPARAARDAAASPRSGPWQEGTGGWLRELRGDTAAVTTASLMSDYGLLAQALPGLIGRAELGQVTGASEETVGIEPVLSDLYAVAAWTLIKADRPEAAWIAAERSMRSAAAADDCLRAAAATRCLAEVHMRAGRFEDAERIAFLATAHLDAAPRADRDVALCLRGAAMLSAAAAAARRGASYEAYAALRAARAYAAELGKDMVALGTMFGPVNVTIHDVAVPVELGRPGDAVRSIPDVPIQVPPYLMERKARFLIDIARGHAGTGDAKAAADALILAEETAPDETRHHRLTRQLISELLPMSPRSSGIRAMAGRCAVPV